MMVDGIAFNAEFSAGAPELKAVLSKELKEDLFLLSVEGLDVSVGFEEAGVRVDGVVWDGLCAHLDRGSPESKVLNFVVTERVNMFGSYRIPPIEHFRALTPRLISETYRGLGFPFVSPHLSFKVSDDAMTGSGIAPGFS